MPDYKKLEREIDRAMLKDSIKFYLLMTVCLVSLGLSLVVWSILIWTWLKG